MDFIVRIAARQTVPKKEAGNKNGETCLSDGRGPPGFIIPGSPGCPGALGQGCSLDQHLPAWSKAATRGVKSAVLYPVLSYRSDAQCSRPGGIRTRNLGRKSVIPPAFAAVCEIDGNEYLAKHRALPTELLARVCSMDQVGLEPTTAALEVHVVPPAFAVIFNFQSEATKVMRGRIAFLTHPPCGVTAVSRFRIRTVAAMYSHRHSPQFAGKDSNLHSRSQSPLAYRWPTRECVAGKRGARRQADKSFS